MAEGKCIPATNLQLQGAFKNLSQNLLLTKLIKCNVPMCIVRMWVGIEIRWYK